MNYFPPERQNGLVVHGALLTVFALVSLLGFALTTQTPVGLQFALWLLLGLGAFFPVPFLAYRIYALLRANYGIDRDSLRLMWGLRIEDIPLSDIDWVRMADDLTIPLKLPFPPLPGGVLGVTRHPDLRTVEFIAADPRRLLLVATAKRVYAISPQDPGAFATAFQHAIEMGSLQPTESESQYPSFVLSQAWEQRPVRAMWLVSLLINIGLLFWVTILIPGLQQVPLGFLPTLEPDLAASPTQFIIIPLISLGLLVTSWLAGLFLFRLQRLRPLAYAVWIGMTLSTLLFLAAVFVLLTTPI